MGANLVPFEVVKKKIVSSGLLLEVIRPDDAVIAGREGYNGSHKIALIAIENFCFQCHDKIKSGDVRFIEAFADDGSVVAVPCHAFCVNPKLRNSNVGLTVRNNNFLKFIKLIGRKNIAFLVSDIFECQPRQFLTLTPIVGQ
jgi:hypothetical protein